MNLSPPRQTVELISKGDPLGASALGQICEALVQLRGQAGPRQVANAKVGLPMSEGHWATRVLRFQKFSSPR